MATPTFQAGSMNTWTKVLLTIIMHTFIGSRFCIGYSITETASRPFLSWQTWDLLRVMVYGFRGFCEDFLRRNPGYTIYPVRLNGSAIETFFSQLKYPAGGHKLVPCVLTCRTFRPSELYIDGFRYVLIPREQSRQNGSKSVWKHHFPTILKLHTRWEASLVTFKKRLECLQLQPLRIW